MISPDTAAGVLIGALLSGVANVGLIGPSLLAIASPRTVKLVKGARA